MDDTVGAEDVDGYEAGVEVDGWTLQGYADSETLGMAEKFFGLEVGS